MAGLTADLHLAGWQYSLASAIFFVSYIALVRLRLSLTTPRALARSLTVSLKSLRACFSPHEMLSSTLDNQYRQKHHAEGDVSVEMEYVLALISQAFLFEHDIDHYRKQYRLSCSSGVV